MNRRPENIRQLLSDESYHRFIAGSADIKEAKEWQRWINEHSDHLEMHEEAKRILNSMRITSQYQPDVKQARDHLEAKLQHLSSAQSQQRESRINWAMLFKAAAAIMLIAVSSYFYWGVYLSQKAKDSVPVTTKTIATNYGVQKTIKLSNGSRIILAPHSSISYQSDWLKKSVKKVKLKGAAYFDIREKRKANNHLPEYEIDTPDGIIRDYGTQFNVSTFNNYTTVVLQKGIVAVVKKDSHQAELKLKPKQMAVLSRAKESVVVRNVDPRVYTSWTTHLLYFDHTPLKELTQSLSNRYGLKFIVQDPSLLQKKLTGAIDKTDVNSLLSVVARVLHLKITVKGDTVHIRHLDL
ncbi:MAG TPA: FecR domain-containing protein [Balneolales bacterium]|nr:FecR domain-containing protein [Balneolales bacterium]